MDFPIPGSPPTKTSEPLTTPPPSTLSSSSKPVLNLSSSSSCISDSLAGFLYVFADIPLLTVFVFATGSSTRLFHALHIGHCPNHFGDSYPHSLQKNALDFAFAIKTFLFKMGISGLPICPCNYLFLIKTFDPFSLSSTLNISLPDRLVFMPPILTSST